MGGGWVRWGLVAWARVPGALSRNCVFFFVAKPSPLGFRPPKSGRSAPNSPLPTFGFLVYGPSGAQSGKGAQPELLRARNGVVESSPFGVE